MNVVDRARHLLARRQAHGAGLGHEVPPDFFPARPRACRPGAKKAVNGGCPNRHRRSISKLWVSAACPQHGSDARRQPQKICASARNLCRIAPKRPKTGRIVGTTMAHSVLGAGNLGLR
jgi:hypothetical protein